MLDVYHAGLQVPDEVTLMWCDDNYGYIRHFPTAEERARKEETECIIMCPYWGVCMIIFGWELPILLGIPANVFGIRAGYTENVDIECRRY